MQVPTDGLRDRGGARGCFRSGWRAPAPGTGGVFSAVRKGGRVPAIIATHPTTHPCVNRIELAVANTAGL